MSRAYIPFILLVSSIPAHVLSAPGTLSNSPLYLKSAVEPNFVFLTDDSGSMDSDMMTPFDDGIYRITGSSGSSRDYWNTLPVVDNAYESGSGSPPNTSKLRQHNKKWIA